MRPIIIKIVFVVSLGCAAALIEATSSQKINPEACLWIAIGVVVLFFDKNGRAASKAPEPEPSASVRAGEPSGPARTTYPTTWPASVPHPAEPSADIDQFIPSH